MSEQAAPNIHLSKRQREICILHAQALSQKEIAYRLGLTLGTVKMYFTATYRRLKVSNGLELMRWWVDNIERGRVAFGFDDCPAGDIPLSGLTE